MKVILGVIVFLVVIVAVACVVGYSLPKAHTTARSAVYNRPADSVWAAITDFQGQARWRTDIKSIGPAPDRNGKPVWREVSKRGDTVPYETTEMEPPRRLVRTI